MRLPICFTVAFLVCVLVLASQNSLAVAQDGNAASTIRLTSAVEPAPETTTSQSTSASGDASELPGCPGRIHFAARSGAILPRFGFDDIV